MRILWKVLWLIVGAGIGYLAIEQWPRDSRVGQRPQRTASQTPLPDVTRFWPHQTQPGPATRLAISVVDGDTISVVGRPNVRLVGCDAPEAGTRGKCDRERELAKQAATRLSELVAKGPVQLTYVQCSCPEGTQGTTACDHGRDCGKLSVGGRDACSILIAEGLAHIFVCGLTSCPSKRSWCN
jgi:endonuclease YncB( thermonuclease family)